MMFRRATTCGYSMFLAWLYLIVIAECSLSPSNNQGGAPRGEFAAKVQEKPAETPKVKKRSSRIGAPLMSSLRIPFLRPPRVDVRSGHKTRADITASATAASATTTTTPSPKMSTTSTTRSGVLESPGVNLHAPNPRGTNDHTQNNWLQQRRRVKSWFRILQNSLRSDTAQGIMTGVQVGIVVYMTLVIVQSVREVMDEVQQQENISNSSSSSEESSDRPRFSNTPGHVRRVLLHLEKGLPASHLRFGTLGEKLHRLGYPLRDTTSTTRKKKPIENFSPDPSVESVLSSLTSSEASILEEALWAPPKHSQQRSWSGVLGLSQAKHRLSTAVARLQGAQEEGPDASPYAPLFHRTAGVTEGLLLYGPPGCGKSMLMRSLSSFGDAGKIHPPCLILSPSLFFRKYVGETNLRVRDMWRAVQKLQTSCFVCLDELDGLFRERSSSSTEQASNRDFVTEFLSWWDGILTTSSSATPASVLVVGATNRPWDVDPAVLRRLPLHCPIGLPQDADRAEFLNFLLDQVPRCPGLDLDWVITKTRGYCCSDLKHVLKVAATVAQSQDQHNSLCTAHFQAALTQVPPTPLKQSYRQHMEEFANARESQQLVPSPNANSIINSNSAAGDQKAGHYDARWGHFYDAGTIEINGDNDFTFSPTSDDADLSSDGDEGEDEL